MSAETESPGDVRVSLYVRADHGTTEDLVDRLDDLREGGRIDSYEVSTWPSRIDASHDSSELRKVQEFMEWAGQNDVSLHPGFSWRELESSFTGEVSEVVVLPSVAVAVYRDGELRGVAPCRDGNEVFGVRDYLDEIEEDDEYLLVSRGAGEKIAVAD